MALTSKQERFSQEVASGKNQSDAYRVAYEVKPGTKPSSVNVSAAKLMAMPNIAQRVAELRKPIVEIVQITLETHLARLEHLGKMAEASEKWDAAIKAEIGRAKAAGIVTDKIEAKLSGGLEIGVSARPKLTKEEWLKLHGLGTTGRPTE